MVRALPGPCALTVPRLRGPAVGGVTPNDCCDRCQQHQSGHQSLQSCREDTGRWPWCEGSAHSPRGLRPQAFSGNAKLEPVRDNRSRGRALGRANTKGSAVIAATWPEELCLCPLGSSQGESGALETRHATGTGHTVSAGWGLLPPSQPCWLLQPGPMCRAGRDTQGPLARLRLSLQRWPGQWPRDAGSRREGAEPGGALHQGSCPYKSAHRRLSVSEIAKDAAWSNVKYGFGSRNLKCVPGSPGT